MVFSHWIQPGENTCFPPTVWILLQSIFIGISTVQLRFATNNLDPEMPVKNWVHQAMSLNGVFFWSDLFFGTTTFSYTRIMVCVYPPWAEATEGVLLHWIDSPQAEGPLPIHEYSFPCLHSHFTQPLTGFLYVMYVFHISFRSWGYSMGKFLLKFKDVYLEYQVTV